MSTFMPCTDRIGLANEDLRRAANDAHAEEALMGLFDRFFMEWSERAYQSWLARHPEVQEAARRRGSR